MGVASYKLLKSLGVDVDYPLDQTCCGQPMANAGFEDEASKLALRFDDLFKQYDYIVGPSGSCVAFVKLNHPDVYKRQLSRRYRIWPLVRIVIIRMTICHLR